MSDLLYGKTLNWMCWDSSNLLTAMLQATLTDWAEPKTVKLRLSRVAELSDFEKRLALETVGLAVWALWDDESLERVCGSLSAVRDSSQSPVRVCFVVPELARHVSLLTEAGGQIVVSQLHSLPAMMLKILDHCQLADHGYHPLTSGLVDRLPWSGWS